MTTDPTVMEICLSGQDWYLVQPSKRPLGATSKGMFVVSKETADELERNEAERSVLLNAYVLIRDDAEDKPWQTRGGPAVQETLPLITALAEVARDGYE